MSGTMVGPDETRSARQGLLQSIAATIADYRCGEIPAPDAPHVERWISQFDGAVQEPMLAEMDHVLKQCYLSQGQITQYLRALATRTHLLAAGSLRTRFCNVMSRLLGRVWGWRRWPRQWQHAQFLQIQHHGGSQIEMVRLLRELLEQQYGARMAFPGSVTGPFVYVDDILFTGARIIIDLQDWIQTQAPLRADVVIIVIACYRRGLRWAHRAILRAAATAGKRIRLHWIRFADFDNRRWIPNGREGFHPASLPAHALVDAYVDELSDAGHVPRLRLPNAAHPSRIFSSEEGRHLLEQQLLLAGVRIRAACKHPHAALRPLGYDVAPGLGFGATLVTYRNCPNNCPLAWWWQLPHAPADWYPLFPRRV